MRHLRDIRRGVMDGQTFRDAMTHLICQKKNIFSHVPLNMFFSFFFFFHFFFPFCLVSLHRLEVRQGCKSNKQGRWPTSLSVHPWPDLKPVVDGPMNAMGKSSHTRCLDNPLIHQLIGLTQFFFMFCLFLNEKEKKNDRHPSCREQVPRGYNDASTCCLAR